VLALASSTAARKRNLDDIGSHEERGKRRKAGEWALCQLSASCLPFSSDSLPSLLRITFHSYMHHNTDIYIYSQILQLWMMALMPNLVYGSYVAPYFIPLNNVFRV
jgi:hypothetical protein